MLRGILFSIIRIHVKWVEMFLLIISAICFIIRWSLCNFEEFPIDDVIMKTENLRSKCYLEWKTCDEQTHPGGKFELVKMQRLIWRHNPDLIILIHFAQYAKMYIIKFSMSSLIRVLSNMYACNHFDESFQL